MKCKFWTVSKQYPFGLDGSKKLQQSAWDPHHSSGDHRLATCNKNPFEVFTKTVHEKLDKMKQTVKAMTAIVVWSLKNWLINMWKKG